MHSNDGVPVFLVMGSTGEYDDYHEWVVCVYREFDSAQDHAKMANEESAKLFSENSGRTFINHKGVYDENMHIDYTGTTYFIEESVLHTVFRN